MIDTASRAPMQVRVLPTQLPYLGPASVVKIARYPQTRLRLLLAYAKKFYAARLVLVCHTPTRSLGSKWHVNNLTDVLSVGHMTFHLAFLRRNYTLNKQS
jgi:hypothetical protein